MASFVSHCIGNWDPSLSIFDSTISSALPPSNASPVCPPLPSRRVSIIVRYIPRKSLSTASTTAEEDEKDIDWIVSARTKSPPSEGYREGNRTEKWKKKKEGKERRRQRRSEDG